jgi:hypothetical protein
MCNFAAMKQTVMIIGLCLIAAGTNAHPLHLSVTNITYENGTLQVIMKTFRDDWETAYFHYHSRMIDFTEREKREIPWFREYLDEKFRLSVNEKSREISLVIDTITLDEDAMTIELHASPSAKPNSLYIYNALLTDIYPDQTNLVILGYANRQAGIKFDVIKHDAEVQLN